jgi:hypothetical protein
MCLNNATGSNSTDEAMCLWSYMLKRTRIELKIRGPGQLLKSKDRGTVDQEPSGPGVASSIKNTSLCASLDTNGVGLS